MYSFFDQMADIPRSTSVALASSSSSAAPAQEVCLEPVALQDTAPLELANKLRSGSFDRSSHVDFLEAEVKSQLAFAQKNLESLEQKKVFQQFQLEFEQCVANKSLSYEWWICFAHRLTILITPETYRKTSYVTPGEHSEFIQEMLEHNLWHRHDDFMAFVNRKGSLRAEMFSYVLGLFPEYVLIPSTLGDFSLTLLNRGVADKIYPLGIISKGMWADGQFFYPDRYIRHDWVHFTNWHTLGFDEQRSIWLFQDFMLQLIDETTDPKLKLQYEFMLFLLYHEVPWNLRMICINKGDGEEFSNSQLQSRLLSDEGNPEGVLKLCCSDRWYAPLFAGYASTEDEIRRFTLEAVGHFIVCLNEFFTFIHRDTFEGEPRVKRDYKVDTPLSDEEKASHWTKAIPDSNKKMLQTYDKIHPGFFHYLVRHDSQGPEHSGLSITQYLLRKRTTFQYLDPEKIDMKQLVDKIRKNTVAQQEVPPSDEPCTSTASYSVCM